MLAADKLMESPRLYATFLLFLLSELFEELPEVGDPDKPKLVFFFDEAHLLFRDAPKALLEKVEQVVRLIRSKGVGVYFVTQNPLDIPDTVSRQLGNRVQHALRAFTPPEQKAVRSAAQTFRKNPEDRYRAGHHAARHRRGAGLDARREGPAQHGRADTWSSRRTRRVGPITEAERKAIINASPVSGEYDETEDRASAYETLQKRTAERAEAEQLPGRREAPAKKKPAAARAATVSGRRSARLCQHRRAVGDESADGSCSKAVPEGVAELAVDTAKDPRLPAPAAPRLLNLHAHH